MGFPGCIKLQCTWGQQWEERSLDPNPKAGAPAQHHPPQNMTPMIPPTAASLKGSLPPLCVICGKSDHQGRDGWEASPQYPLTSKRQTAGKFLPDTKNLTKMQFTRCCQRSRFPFFVRP
eukprot:EG_transcript_24444